MPAVRLTSVRGVSCTSYGRREIERCQWSAVEDAREKQIAAHPSGRLPDAKAEHVAFADDGPFRLVCNIVARHFDIGPSDRGDPALFGEPEDIASFDLVRATNDDERR
jgi:hypothetical protein